jgi:hypothetical protein
LVREWRVVPAAELKLLSPDLADKPESGKQYRLTGGPGVRCIANGDRWSDSVVDGADA